MKSQIEALIDRLASKELTFGCEVTLLPCEGTQKPRRVRLAWFENDNFQTDSNITDSDYYDIDEILGHPILIGTVLEKMQENKSEYMSGLVSAEEAEVVGLWGKVGFKKSLQEIYADVEWEQDGMQCTGCDYIGSHQGLIDHVVEAGVTKHAVTERFVTENPAHRNLFEFLLSLGL